MRDKVEHVMSVALEIYLAEKSKTRAWNDPSPSFEECVDVVLRMREKIIKGGRMKAMRGEE